MKQEVDSLLSSAANRFHLEFIHVGLVGKDKTVTTIQYALTENFDLLLKLFLNLIESADTPNWSISMTL